MPFSRREGKREDDEMTAVGCGMGEGYGLYQMGDDSAFMLHIHVASVACGFHPSDFNHRRSTVRLAGQHGI